MYDLHDLNIVVTRPKPQGEELCTLIEKYGGKAIYFPTIALVSLVDHPAFQQQVALLHEQDWLIFVSPQAVYASAKAILAQWPTLPAQVKIAAIGEGTAKALQAAGISAVLYPENEWSSEGLLALADFQSIANKKIMIVRGTEGRDLLDKTLSARGAHVTHTIAYERVLPPVDQRADLPHGTTIHAIIGTSFASVQNIKILLANEGALSLFQIPLIVVSERIKMLAHDLGFQTIWIARHASHTVILQLLAKKRNELCQMAIQKK